MPTRTTPSLRPFSRLLSTGPARRQARRAGEQQLARALSGDFGPGVRADVLAAQKRSALGDRTAA